jgi:hypothetical protein
MPLKGKIKKPALIHKYKDVFNERAQNERRLEEKRRQTQTTIRQLDRR